MGRVLADVAPVEVPLVLAMIEAIGALDGGDLTVVQFQARILALLREMPPGAALAQSVAAALRAKTDQPLARRSFADRDYTIQILYVAPHEVHPCHCHHNVTSTQVVLTGRLLAREFDRVAWASDGTLRLRLMFAGELGPSDYLQASDGHRNAHWFAAGDEPATLLNFNIRGYEDVTFFPHELRPLGRRLLDVTCGVEDSFLIAQMIDAAAAYARFGGRPLSDFPLAVAPLERSARSLLSDEYASYERS